MIRQNIISDSPQSVQALSLFLSPIFAALGSLRWGLFLSDEKETKESPKAGPSPAFGGFW